jgi:hypothetical protein
VTTTEPPASYQRDNCLRCPARILWAYNDHTGNKAPIDYEPAEDGNVELLGHGLYRVIPKAELERRRAGPTLTDQEVEPLPTLYKNHFATCPNPPKRRSR